MPLDQRQIDELKAELAETLHGDALLFSLRSSTEASLFGKSAVWIPRAVSDKAGGRKSIYDIDVGEPVLMGFYVVDQQIIQKWVTRTDDTHYAMTLKRIDGMEIFSGRGEMEIVNKQIGFGRMKLDGEVTPTAMQLFGIPHELRGCSVDESWFVWSMIYSRIQRC